MELRIAPLKAMRKTPRGVMVIVSVTIYFERMFLI